MKGVFFKDTVAHTTGQVIVCDVLNIDNDVYLFGTPKSEEAQIQRISPEEINAVGLVTAGKTNKEAIRELVEFYQRPDLDKTSAIFLYDFYGQAQYFGSQPSQEQLEASKRRMSQHYKEAQLPERVKRQGMTVVIGEKAGQLVGEVCISGTIEDRDKEIAGHTLYLLSRSADGHWRFINFDISF